MPSTVAGPRGPQTREKIGPIFSKKKKKKTVFCQLFFLRSFSLVRSPRQTSKIVSKFFLKVLKIHLFFRKKTERRISKKRLKKWVLYHRFIFSKQELGSTREFNFTAVSKLGFFFYRPRGDSDPRFRSPIEKRPIFMYNMYSKIFRLFLTIFGCFSAKMQISPKVWLVGAQIEGNREGVHLAQ